LEGELKKTATLMLPKMLQLGMWQIMLWWFVRLASRLEEGSVTIYSFARNFQSLPVSLIGVAIALAAFAKLSHVAAERDFVTFKAIVREKTWVIVTTTTLAAIALAILSRPLIHILLGGGKFDETAVALTASLLAVYTLSIPFESLMHFLSRAHYALQNTMRASLIHIATIVLTLCLSYFLVEHIGLYAIPIGFTAGLVLHILILEISLRQLVGKLSKAALKEV
jgi:putative peptidoglycan lipid II flippase